MNLDQLCRLDGLLNRYLQDCYRDEFLSGAVTREEFDARAVSIKTLRKHIREKVAAAKSSDPDEQVAPGSPADRSARAERRRSNRIKNIIAPARQAMRTGRLLSLDVECIGGQYDTVTEVGVTVLQDGAMESFHAITEEYLNVDTRWTANRWRFGYGESLVLPKRRIVEWLGDHLGAAPVLVGHDIKSDFRFLESLIRIDAAGIHDTAHMSRAIYGRALGLSTLCGRFGVKADVPHNAGNDARYTMEVLMAIIAREQELLVPEAKILVSPSPCVV